MNVIRRLWPGLVVALVMAAIGGGDHAAAAEVRAAVAKLQATFTIVEQASVEGGMDFGDIPHCMLFDHTGKCVYRGSPFEVGEAALAAEAEFVVARLEARGKEMLDEADDRKADDPLAAVETLQRCAAAFKGSVIGVDADKRLKEWKKDAAFRAAVKAAALERTSPAR